MPKLKLRVPVLALAALLLTVPASARAESDDVFCSMAPAQQALYETVEDLFPNKAIGRWVAFFNRKIADLCLRLNDVQVIGSHNSYHIEPSQALLDLFLSFDPMALAWQYSHDPLPVQFEADGIRQIELDVFADPEGGLYSTRIALSLIGEDIESGEPALDEPGFKVLHVQHSDFDTTCLTFVACLEQVKAWSDANPNHLPILILVEAKDSDFFVPILPTVVKFDSALYRDLDAEILSVFPEDRIILPDDVRHTSPTLEHAILTKGWPTLGKLRGKVMFAHDNGGAHRDLYRDGAESLEGRILFTNSTPGEPDAAFVKVNNPQGSDPNLIPDLVSAGYVVRTRADGDTEQARTGDTTQRDAALASGAQWVSTDYFRPDPRFTDYSVDLPGDLPARCNPVRAPAICRDVALGRE